MRLTARWGPDGTVRKLTQTSQIICNYGPGFLAFRAQYALRKKLGLLKRRFPAAQWSQVSIESWLRADYKERSEDFLEIHKANGRRFFFDGNNVVGLNRQFKEKIVAQAGEVFQNRFQYFFDRNYDLGPGPDWFLNPTTERRAEPTRHWCDISLFDPNVGDIKFIWEPSRFAWAYTLVRAYTATGQDRYAEKFWSLFESWLEANKPNMGPNYACGQECAIRLMAMCFALYALSEANASTAERRIKLITAIAVHADRIEKNINFAISTRTNHSLTEAAGLYTAGLLFPQFKRSDHWLRLGKKVLTNEGLKQIYPDGSYIQHSMNYHRLMLQDFLWVLRLAQLNSDSFCEQMVSRVAKAVEFLYQMQDESSGRVPNYGANDGALIIPLNNCDYLDYRPVLQAMNYLFNKTRLYEPGAWDEDILWFFGPEISEAPVEARGRQSSECQHGGYYTLRNKNSWAMLRCHSYRDRPGHADALHLDLWWKGINVLRDSGTYMYNCDEPWQSYFSSTPAHNAVTINGVNQMTKASRFAWFDWTKAKLVMHKSFESGFAKVMQGERYGYKRQGKNIVHRRSVLSLADACWLVVDDILGSGVHDIRLNWQLCDVDYEQKGDSIVLKTERGVVCLTVLCWKSDSRCDCVKGGEDGPAGWQSLYYGNRKLAPTLIYSKRADLPARLITLVSLGDVANGLAFGVDDMVSWQMDKLGEKLVVKLNSIADSDNSTFSFIEHASKRLSLD